MSPVVIALIFSMLAVMWLDATRYIIPNWLVVFVLALYPVALWQLHHAVDWHMAIVAMLAVLVGGYIIFALKFMGAGDIKLLSALALWMGWGEQLLDFILIVTVLGGFFALFLWLGRKVFLLIPVVKNLKNLPRILQEGAPVPYGVAIALAFLYMMKTGKIAAIL